MIFNVFYNSAQGDGNSLQEKTVTPTADNIRDGFIIVPDPEKDGMSKVTIVGDSDFNSENIKSGIIIFGINGKTEVVDTSVGNGETAASDSVILNNRIAYVNGNKITGSMTNRGAVAGLITNANTAYTVPEGYHNGSGTVSIDRANLTANNIKDGVSILGVSGTVTPANYISGTVTPTSDVLSISISSTFRPTVFAIISDGDVSYNSSKTYMMAGIGIFNGNADNLQSFGNKHSGVSAAISKTTSNTVGSLGIDGYITDNGNGTYTTQIRRYNNSAYFKSGEKYGYILAN